MAKDRHSLIRDYLVKIEFLDEPAATYICNYCGVTDAGEFTGYCKACGNDDLNKVEAATVPLRTAIREALNARYGKPVAKLKSWISIFIETLSTTYAFLKRAVQKVTYYPRRFVAFFRSKSSGFRKAIIIVILICAVYFAGNFLWAVVSFPFKLYQSANNAPNRRTDITRPASVSSTKTKSHNSRGVENSKLVSLGSSDIKYLMVSTLRANLRVGAGEKFGEIKKIPFGSKVRILGYKNNGDTRWFQISHESTVGFISENVSCELRKFNVALSRLGSVNKPVVNVRRGPGTNWKVIRQIKTR